MADEDIRKIMAELQEIRGEIKVTQTQFKSIEAQFSDYKRFYQKVFLIVLAAALGTAAVEMVGKFFTK